MNYSTYAGLSLIQRASDMVITALKSEFCACRLRHCFQPMACGSLWGQNLTNCLFTIVVDNHYVQKTKIVSIINLLKVINNLLKNTLIVAHMSYF